MGSKNAEPRAKEHPTVLTGKRDDVNFEVWVEIDDKPLKVYGESDMEDDASEAWIASENGKIDSSLENLTATDQAFQDFEAAFYCDGQRIRSKVLVRRILGAEVLCDGRKVNGNQVEAMLFSAPSLLEEDPTEEDVEKLGTIEVVFKRGKRYNSKGWGNGSAPPKVNLGDAVSERAKKVLGSLTKLGDTVMVKESLRWNFSTHPDDKNRGFFRMVFHYGPEDLLRAQGHIPPKESGRSEGQGTSKRKAVRLEDEEDVKNGCTVSKAPEKEDGDAQKIPSEKARKLEALRERLRELEEIAELKAQIRALEDDVGQKNDTRATASSKGKGKADGEGRAFKKARNGGT